MEESEIRDDLFADFGFAGSIAEESKEAAKIKNRTPIMVVIGNPPYSGESSNTEYKSHDVYKIEPSGGKLQEKNSKWINDDYVKFIRLAESMIEKTAEGIVAMITAHGYLDNPTFRGMRFHLMKTFDVIYVIDLHGNANKKEKSPDGSDDKNVFDIKQGVAIFLGIKKREPKPNDVKIFRADCFGPRSSKFEFLNANSIESIKWEEVRPSSPNYEWVSHDEKLGGKYISGFSVADLFPINVLGYQTHRDNFAVAENQEELKKRLDDFIDLSIDSQNLVHKYQLNIKSWDMNTSRKQLQVVSIHDYISKTAYRPFDTRFVILHPAISDRPRTEIVRNMVNKENLGLLCSRQQATPGFRHVFVTNMPANDCVMSTVSREANQVFPLYLYAKDGTKHPNLKQEIVDEIEEVVGKVSPENIFDYIYAVLHSPSYREKYKEFLKIDFPRVPYPKDSESFNALIKYGTELRSIHLLESPKVNRFITTYPNAGSDKVEKLVYKDGNVFINSEQYFGNVPEKCWNFYIGGYQPAQKWLKDRKERTLTNEDIEHYQKIIVALWETERIMKEIDKIVDQLV